jgi:hypothetical protein
MVYLNNVPDLTHSGSPMFLLPFTYSIFTTQLESALLHVLVFCLFFSITPSASTFPLFLLLMSFRSLAATPTNDNSPIFFLCLFLSIHILGSLGLLSIYGLAYLCVHRTKYRRIITPGKPLDPGQIDRTRRIDGVKHPRLWLEVLRLQTTAVPMAPPNNARFKTQT